MDAMWLLTTVAYLVPPVVIVGGLTMWFLSKRRKTAHLDEWWGWLGRGTAWKGNGRAFAGTLGGRNVTVTWFDGNTTVTVDGSPTVRAGFGRRDRPDQVVDEANDGGRRVVVDAQHVGFGETRGDVRAILARPGVREALDVLLAQDEDSMRSVDIEPDTGVVWFARNLREADTTPAFTRRWTEAVVALAEAAEHPVLATQWSARTGLP